MDMSNTNQKSTNPTAKTARVSTLTNGDYGTTNLKALSRGYLAFGTRMCGRAKTYLDGTHNCNYKAYRILKAFPNPLNNSCIVVDNV